MAAERREKKRREAIAAHPRRLAHEAMMVVAPPWAGVARKLIGRMRPPPGALPVLAEERQIGSAPDFLEMLEGRLALETQYFGWDVDLARANVQCLCTLAECAINYEIGGRKAEASPSSCPAKRYSTSQTGSSSVRPRARATFQRANLDDKSTSASGCGDTGATRTRAGRTSGFAGPRRI